MLEEWFYLSRYFYVNYALLNKIAFYCFCFVLVAIFFICVCGGEYFENRKFRKGGLVEFRIS